MIKYTGHIVIMRDEITGDIKQFYYPIPDWIRELDRINPPPSFELSMAYEEAVFNANEDAPAGYDLLSVIAV